MHSNLIELQDFGTSPGTKRGRRVEVFEEPSKPCIGILDGFAASDRRDEPHQAPSVRPWTTESQSVDIFAV